MNKEIRDNYGINLRSYKVFISEGLNIIQISKSVIKFYQLFFRWDIADFKNNVLYAQ